MAGSTHAGEEEDAVLQAFVVARQKIPGLRMILVPRHPWRFDGAADACRALGLSVVRRSSGEAASASTDVFLVDTMGELRAFYSLCDVAFVGGSLAPEGGHNLLEAAAFRVPVIMGPHLYDIDDIAEPFREAGALKVVADADELAAQLTKWSLDVEAGAVAGERAKGLFDANQGATRRSVERVLAHARRFDSAG